VANRSNAGRRSGVVCPHYATLLFLFHPDFGLSCPEFDRGGIAITEANKFLDEGFGFLVVWGIGCGLIRAASMGRKSLERRQAFPEPLN
jgi:hypothetical protein